MTHADFMEEATRLSALVAPCWQEEFLKRFSSFCSKAGIVVERPIVVIITEHPTEPTL